MTGAFEPDADRGDLVEHILALSRDIRRAGAKTTPFQTREALRGLPLIDLENRLDFKNLLRTCLVSTREEGDLFDYYFESIFNPWFSRTPPASSHDPGPGFPGPPDRGPSECLLERSDSPARPRTLAVGAGLEETWMKKDFAGLSPAEAAEARRLIRRLARRLAARLKTPRRGKKGPGDVDFPRTLRASLQTGGEPFNLRRRKKKVRPGQAVMFCDVSGSMEIHTRFFLVFMSCFSQIMPRTETFIFSTRLARLSGLPRRAPSRFAMEGPAGEGLPFYGGTAIGACLQEFLDRYVALLSRRTLFFILSDGWDRGDPAVLRSALSRLKSRVAGIFWLNPLAADENFAPLAGGMAAALPFLTVLAPFSRPLDVSGLADRLTGPGAWRRPFSNYRLDSTKAGR
ncbi:MAG: VWA domain-containing protein [Pseudomonadota bacterium]